MGGLSIVSVLIVGAIAIVVVAGGIIVVTNIMSKDDH